jgi:AcrR family transcriptional regulator
MASEAHTEAPTEAPVEAQTEAPVGAHSDVRSRRREQTRAEIIAAAWRLAERDGIAGLSLRDLGVEVGMRAPSLYTYVANKAAIYDEMFAVGYHELADVLHGDALDVDDPIGSLAGRIAAFVDFCQASVPRYQLMFTRAVPDWRPSETAYAVSMRTYERMTHDLARLGIDDPRAVDLVTAVTAGLAAQQLANDPDGDRWRRLSRDAAEMLLTQTRRM